MQKAVTTATSCHRRRNASDSSGGRLLTSGGAALDAVVGNRLLALVEVAWVWPGCFYLCGHSAGNLLILTARGGSGGFRFRAGRVVTEAGISAVRINHEGSDGLTDEGSDAETGAMTRAAAWPQKALLVASSGGHLAQLLALEPWWSARR